MEDWNPSDLRRVLKCRPSWLLLISQYAVKVCCKTWHRNHKNQALGLILSYVYQNAICVTAGCRSSPQPDFGKSRIIFTTSPYPISGLLILLIIYPIDYNVWSAAKKNSNCSVCNTKVQQELKMKEEFQDLPKDTVRRAYAGFWSCHEAVVKAECDYFKEIATFLP